MKDELLAMIRSRGYWRVHFRPLAPGGELSGPTKCLAVVGRASVSLRGWDYPHVPGANHADNISILNDSADAVTDFGLHKEYWRMYESSQFIHFRAVQEDWRDVDPFSEPGPNVPPRQTVLGITNSVWFIAEVFEFLARLAAEGLYEDGVEVTVSLHGASDRKLWVDSSERAPLTSDRTTAVDTIKFNRRLSKAEIFDQKARAIEAISYVFERFRFLPPEKQLIQMIDELYGLGIGRG